MLASYTDTDRNNWTDYIDLCVFAYNTSVLKNKRLLCIKRCSVEQHVHHFPH